MKPTVFPKLLGHACALAAGAALAWWLLPQMSAASTGASAVVSSTPSLGAASGEPAGKASATARNHKGSTSTIGERSKVYREAWDELLRRKLPNAEREALQIKLLAEWVEIDPDAAVSAALIELGRTGAYASNSGLLSAFTRKMREQPGIFWPLIKEKRFGLKTAFLQQHWLDVVGRHDPDLLLGYFDEFSGPLKSKAIKSVLEGLNDDPVKTREVMTRLAQLPDNPESREMWKAAGKQISTQGLEAMAKGLSESKTPGEEAIYLQGLASFGGWKPLKIGELRGQLEAMPEATGKKAALGVLGETYFPDTIADIADYLMDQGDWETLSKQVPIRMHQAVPSRDQGAFLAWAAEMPERQETEDLYRTSIRNHINGDPAKARDWIEAMPAGWKRDNALVEYVNSSLHTRKDSIAAEWAIERIEGEHFLGTAEEMKKGWEASKKK